VYFLYCRLKEFFLALGKNGDKIDESLLNDLLSAYREFNNDALIKGENVYIWGACGKLGGEGSFNVRATEGKGDNGAVRLVSEMIRKVQAGTYTEEDIRSMIKMQNGREDDALRCALKGTENGKERMAVIVYGNAHDFSGNLLKMQDSGIGKEFGCIKLNNKQELEWDKIRERAFPGFIEPSLKDRHE
jgi:hypothetical protein